MIPRRQFIRSLLPALAVLALPLSAPALPTAVQPQRSPKPGSCKLEWIDDEFLKPYQVKLIGVGGAGGNAVNHLVACGLQGVEFICANTDAQALSRSGAPKTIQLGRSGLGTGSNTDLGREAAAGNEDEIRAAIEGADMLFITAGMGGGTGSGAAPVIARIAKNMGIPTVGMVTMPFEFEGIHRLRHAEAGLTELQAHVDSLIVVPNEKLLKILGQEVTQEEAFDFFNDQLKSTLDLIARVGYASYGNPDFLDVCTILGLPGRAIVGTGAASGPGRAQTAVEQAMSGDLMEGIDLSKVGGVLVKISAVKSASTFKETNLIMKTVRAHVCRDAFVCFGLVHDESLNDEIRVTLVATGVNFWA